jgi:hypothetical protein
MPADTITRRCRSSSPGHTTARYLARLDALADQMGSTPGLPDHETYRATLKAVHGRKTAFWSLVSRS